MNEQELIKGLRESVILGDPEKAKKLAQNVISAGLDPIKVIEEHLVPAIKIVGEKFERMEYFLTDLMMAGEAMKAATEVLTYNIGIGGKVKSEKKGTIVIGTVKGDIHDIGKNIVALLLQADGFDVYDLGKDVDSIEFIKKAEEVNADIIGLSALLTVTKYAQKEVIDLMKSAGLRNKYKVVIGGGAVSAEWCREIGADGWAQDAISAVKVVNKLIEERRKSCDQLHRNNR